MITPLEANEQNYCDACGEAWAVHNDDGSCVDDEAPYCPEPNCDARVDREGELCAYHAANLDTRLDHRHWSDRTFRRR